MIVKAFEIKNSDDLKNFKQCFLVKKGVINNLWISVKKNPSIDKEFFGKKINDLKSYATKKYKKNINFLNSKEPEKGENKDLTLSSHKSSLGGRHPLSLINNEIISIFNKIGFSVEYDREIEDDWHNFSALKNEVKYTKSAQNTFISY